MEIKESTRVLKAHDIRGLGSKVAFNFEDIRRRCDEYVEQVRQQTREMLASAEAEAEALRRTAHAEGFSAGRNEGMLRVDSQMAVVADRTAQERLRTTLPAMQAAAEMLRQERDRWLSAWEATAVRMSIAVAEKLIRHELKVNPELSTGMISAALELAIGSPQIRLKLHPDDLRRLGDNAEEVARSITSCGQATLVPDASITPGGCLIETQHGVIDARIESQLERIAAELLPIDS